MSLFALMGERCGWLAGDDGMTQHMSIKWLALALGVATSRIKDQARRRDDATSKVSDAMWCGWQKALKVDSKH